MADPGTAAAAQQIFSTAFKAVLKEGLFGGGGKSPEELAKLRVERLERQLELNRPNRIGGSVEIPRRAVEEVYQADRGSRQTQYTPEARAWLAAELIRSRERLAAFRPPPIAPPPIAPPVVTSPPVVLEPPPRLVVGEVLTPSQKIAYDTALRQFQTVEKLRVFGGRGSVGGALRLGAALWEEFGAEILLENAEKAERARRAAVDAELRKGPLGRRAKTAKRGRIARPPKPPKPPKPPNRVDRARAAAVSQAKAQVQANQVIAKAEDFGSKPQSKGPSSRAGSRNRPGAQPTTANQRPLTRSQMLGIGSAVIAGVQTAGNLLSSAGNTLVSPFSSPNLQTQLQPQTGSGGAGNLYTKTRTAEGQKGEQCRVVCRKSGKKKKKKQSRKVCIDKGTLTKFVKSTLTGN